MSMEALIINADDLGLKPSVNRAIIDSFDRGLINSASLMANMPGFKEAIELIHKNNLGHKIGVHLVLTEGHPLTDRLRSLPFLFGENSELKRPSLKKLFLLNKEEKQLIFNEYAAQIMKIRKNGIPISHLDTHHQIHDAWPILQIILALLKEHRIPKMRILNNLGETSQLHKKTYRHILNFYLKNKKVNFTDFMGSRIDFLTIANNRVDRIVGKKIEVMVHPDYDEDDQLIDRVAKKSYNIDFMKESNVNLWSS